MTDGPRRSPIVSVGNLAMGGRGKTPAVAGLARLLAAAGERPAILSRGYKRPRPEDGVVIVSDGPRLLADLDRSGDEPLMLARALPGVAVLVCEVRAMAAALAETVIGATVRILDDGFQHRTLDRDLDIVLVTAADLTDRPLPFGRLRSPVSALRRADAVVVDGELTAGVRAALARHVDAARTRVFALDRALRAPVPLEGTRPWPLAGPAGGPVVALAGIARPERFARALTQAGWSVARLLRYRDHHPYTARDVAAIANAMAASGAAAVLTTDKDAVRLLPFRPLPVPIAALPLEVTIAPAAEFRDWLLGAIREVRA
jgi:tetraacyldisaccharide 4'-kinase